MSFEPRQAAQAAATSRIEIDRLEAQTRSFATRVAEGLGARAVLLSDHVTWRIRLPQANLHFYGHQVTCMTDGGQTSIQLLVKEGVGLYEAPGGEKCVIFDEMQENQRKLLTVTASGRVTYDSDARGVPLPHHLIGGKRV